MPRVRLDGGLIGVINNPTTSVAGGIWAFPEQAKYQRSASWPAASALLSQVNAAALLVAGGGGGGGFNATIDGGGGGAGALYYNSNFQMYTGTTYTATVGAGGAGGASGASATIGTNGSNTSFIGGGTSYTVIGGGGGGYNTAGASGGSGGGGGGDNTSRAGGASIQNSTFGYGAGNSGGAGNTANQNAGGGGGAGTAGASGTAAGSGSGKGGDGLNYNMNGTLTTYAGGGGGGGGGAAGSGGAAGGSGASQAPSSANNTGGGGGGSSTTGFAAGNGGSGILFISYPLPQNWSGGTVSNFNSTNVVHTFTTSGTLTPLSTPIDTYQSYNTLLLHSDGTNGANNSVFLDTSSINNSITRNGSTTQGTFSPFSTTGWSTYLGGSSALTLPYSSTNFAFHTTDFTVEAWIFPTSYTGMTQGVSNIPTLIGAMEYNTTIADWCLGLTTSGILKFYYYNGSSISINSSTTVPLNTWSHIAMTKTSSGISLFYNGLLVSGPTAISGTPTTTSTTVTIGAQNSTYVSSCYISNARIVKGTALYSSNFTPSITPLTAVTNTTFLGFQDNRFKDNSTVASTITVVSTPTVQPFSPFNPSAAYSTTSVGGSIQTGYTSSDGLVLSAYNTSTCRFTGDFTVECWFYMNNTTGQQTLFTHRTNAYVPILVWVASGTLTLYMSSTNTTWNVINAQTLGTIVPGQWYHYALVRNGSAITSYLNGAVVGAGATSSATLDSSTLPFRVGSTTDASPAYFNGYISNVRMVNGTAVYTSAFTPPTAPLSAITNTTLLLNATNAGIIDSSQKNAIVTYGSAAISTTISKYGGASMYFDGSNTAYATAQTVLFATGTGTGDFTAECWAYPVALYSSALASPTLLAAWNAGGTTGWELCIASQGVYVRNNSSLIINTGGAGNSVTTGQWYHVAIVRYNGTTSLYLNGVSVGSTATSYTYTDTIFTIGGASGNFATCNFFGYIDEVRFTKGYARYTANFTPQTTAFLNT